MEPALNPLIPHDKEKLRRLFRVKKTETEMMETRGYRIDAVYMMKSDRNFSPVNLKGLQNPSLKLDDILKFRENTGLFKSRHEFSSVYFHKDNPQQQILVLYLGNEPGKQVAKKEFEIVAQFIQTQQYKHIIIVTETGLNSESNNIVTNRTIGYKIEVFLDYELAFARPKHALSPISVKHVPSNQLKEWSQEEQIQPEKLPMILTIDPISKWLGANPMDAFQYEIMGTTTDTSGYYRIVRQTPSVKK